MPSRRSVTKIFLRLLAGLSLLCGPSLVWPQGTQPAGEPRPSGVGCSVAAPDLYFVDAHSQMDHRVPEARVLSLMDHGGVYRTLLSRHLNRTWQSVVAFAGQADGRIVPMVGTKGVEGGRRPDSIGYLQLVDNRRRLMEEVQSGKHGGMAEVLVWHAGIQDTNTWEVRLELDSAWVTTLLEIAREHGWPFILHIEFASLDADARAAYLRSLEALVHKYPAHPFVMIHMGQLDVAETRRLIAATPNLFFMTSHSNPVSIEMIRSKIWQNLFQGTAIAPEWQELMVEHPDRFVFALDNVFASMWVPGRYLRQMSLWWCGLGRLPPAVAHAIAHGNAERLWRLAPKPAEVRALSPWQARRELGPVVGLDEGGPGTEDRPRNGPEGGRRRGR